MSLTAKVGVSLPRVYGCVEGCPERLRAAVDSNLSLVSLEVAWANGIVVLEAGDCPITISHGSALTIIETAKLSASCDDECVHLPTIGAEYSVVDSLDVVSADLLIGLDIFLRLVVKTSVMESLGCSHRWCWEHGGSSHWRKALEACLDSSLWWRTKRGWC